ncbi:hypothetical protein B0H11DRAFT_2236380 [Mycena galericulata]|nr:hypothetical protein B0H11DRAFT_2236380 [Mycena galericulata]
MASREPNRYTNVSIFPGVERLPPRPGPPTVPTLQQAETLRVRRLLANSGRRTRCEGSSRSHSPPAASSSRSGTRRRRSPSPPRRSRTRLISREERERRQQRGRSGARVERVQPLVEKDLYVDGVLPPPQAPAEDQAHLQCTICLNAKTHPVAYLCGHSHCYACVRLWLEQKFTCPVCSVKMTRPPHRHYAEEDAIAKEFPSWNNMSRVLYCWDGLTFPRTPLISLPLFSDEEEQVSY